MTETNATETNMQAGKLAALEDVLRQHAPLLIAYSGGVDSAAMAAGVGVGTKRSCSAVFGRSSTAARCHPDPGRIAARIF